METYAGDFGVSLDEAKFRFAILEDARTLQAKLRESQSEGYGGLWVNHEPFEVVVNFVAGGRSQIQVEIDAVGLSGVTRMFETRFTEKQLREDQAAIARIVPQELRHGPGIDLRSGHVEVFAYTDEEYEALAATGLPPSVEIVMEPGPPAPALSPIYGGLSLSNGCTAGFSVEVIGDTLEGISTAGHCNDYTEYQGTHLPFQDGLWLGSVDVQWHTTPGFSDPNWVKDGSGAARTVTSRMKTSDMMAGDVVCKYGKTTGYDCGTIDDRSYAPDDACVGGTTEPNTFVYVNNNAGDMADPATAGARYSQVIRRRRGGSWFANRRRAGSEKIRGM